MTTQPRESSWSRGQGRFHHSLPNPCLCQDYFFILQGEMVISLASGTSSSLKRGHGIKSQKMQGKNAGGKTLITISKVSCCRHDNLNPARAHAVLSVGSLNNGGLDIGKVLSARVGFRLWQGSMSLDTSVSTFLESLDASDVLTAIIHYLRIRMKSLRGTFLVVPRLRLCLLMQGERIDPRSGN